VRGGPRRAENSGLASWRSTGGKDERKSGHARGSPRLLSIRLRRHQIYKAASALVFSGRPVETITSLACLVDLDAFKAIVKHLRERQGGESSTALHGFAHALKYIAKHVT
jgi:hypothetical protein